MPSALVTSLQPSQPSQPSRPSRPSRPSVARAAAGVAALALTVTAASASVAPAAEAAAANCVARHVTSSGTLISAAFRVTHDSIDRSVWRVTVDPTFYSSHPAFTISPSSVDITKGNAFTKYAWSGSRSATNGYSYVSSSSYAHVVVNVRFRHDASGTTYWRSCDISF